MVSEHPLLLVFSSTHHALAAEASLAALGKALDVIPTPREISASCGISILVHDGSLAELLSMLDTESGARLKASGLYEVRPSGDGRTKQYEPKWKEK